MCMHFVKPSKTFFSIFLKKTSQKLEKVFFFDVCFFRKKSLHNFKWSSYQQLGIEEFSFFLPPQSNPRLTGVLWTWGPDGPRNLKEKELKN